MRNITFNLCRRIVEIHFQIRSVHTTSSCLINHKWRRERGLPEKLNQYGPLTDLPDYTFMDGRPTPLGGRQRRRVETQREIAQTIVTSCAELGFAKERYQRLQVEGEAKRQEIIGGKLKPKGDLLLSKTK